MIIIGYPGIGKSTLAIKEDDVIDLESSNFNDEYGDKIINWYKYYCNVAVDLHKQGNTVFVSNHEDVYKYLYENYNILKQDIAFIFPCLQLRDGWINKLRDRYIKDKSKKNENAWLRASNCYREDIEKLITFIKDTSCRYWCIGNIDYSLNQIITFLRYNGSSNNIDNVNKICGKCKHFIGAGDFCLCCKIHPELYYPFDKPCEDYDEY